MRIHKLQISNFRGIKSFEHDFGSNDLICFVGRGNSTKSTLLDAISLCLSSKWTVNFSDSDFYNANTDEDINVSITISDIPEKLLNEGKFGLYIRKYNRDSHEFVESDKESENVIPTITINLNVNATLEPEWNVISDNIDPKAISSRDRESLGVFLISDYTDNHLSWTKGSPLLTLQKIITNQDDDSKNIVLEVIREAKKLLEAESFAQFEDLLSELKNTVKSVGGDIDNSKASVDIKDIAFRSNTISLHGDNNIPVRMDGKGAKRLVSIAIQTLLAKNGSLLLIDEVEQGLEPDRVKHLIRTLACNDNGQVFITTHSREVVEEVDDSQIFVVKNSSGEVTCSNKSSSDFQAVYRACPEAVYATKVIVCEGKTEIGFLRAYDKWRKESKKSNLSSMGVVYTLGDGYSKALKRAIKLKELNKDVLVICDSDENKNDDDGDAIKKLKSQCNKDGITVIDWEEGMDIEHQIFKDFDWEVIEKLIDIGKLVQGKKNVEDAISAFTSEPNSDEGRQLLANLATQGKEWFKRIDRGEDMGNILLPSINALGDNAVFKMKFNELNNWIDGQEQT